MQNARVSSSNAAKESFAAAIDGLFNPACFRLRRPEED
jgi:hypothetical protein